MFFLVIHSCWFVSNLCMWGKPSAEFVFDAEIERTFHVRRRQARLARLTSDEEHSVHTKSESKEEGSSDHLGSESEKEEIMVEDPPERLLVDYGGTTKWYVTSQFLNS